MIKIVSYREHQKNTLQGFVTVRMPNIGLEIRDITVHRKENSQWIGLPARPYEKDGKTNYAYIVHFYDKSTKERFQGEVLEALAEYKEPEVPEYRQGADESVPF